MVIRIVTKIELVGPWAMPYPSKKFAFSVIRRTDRQTDGTKNVTSFGGGKNASVPIDLIQNPNAPLR